MKREGKKMERRRFGIVFLLAVLTIGTFQAQAAPLAPGADQVESSSLLARLHRLSGGTARVSFHSETGAVRFIGTDTESPIPQVRDLAGGASPEVAARAFLQTYGSLFGLRAQRDELSMIRSRTLIDGRAFVRFQQTYQGVPILGGELIVQVDAERSIVSASGEILPDLDLDVEPRVGADAARETALTAIARSHGVSPGGLTASEPELWIYHRALLGGPGMDFPALVWRVDVESVDLAPVRELVLVDAGLGNVALHFNQADAALSLRTYDAGGGTALPGTLWCDEPNPSNCPVGDDHEEAAHRYAAATYDFYLNEHGRDSLDGAGMTLTSTVHYSLTSPYEPAYEGSFWNGEQVVHGDTYGYPLAEDIVAHEFTHGVTDHESQLFSFYQSGAINESFSDLWGEFVDLYQVTDNDVGDARWEIGEDIAGLGAVRDMEDPTAFGHPDRMTSANYFCEQTSMQYGTGDNGGVHTNSGVNNKAVYLMTDGGSFNGYTVTGLGYAKVVDLYYEVQTNLLTSGADYADLYDALLQACDDLGYSQADCQEVRDALDAVEMDQQPDVCEALEAPYCAIGVPDPVFFDALESGGGNWVSGIGPGGASAVHWYVPQTESEILPGPYATSGVGNIWGLDQGSPFTGTNISDTYLAMSERVIIPEEAFLHFRHAFGFDSEGVNNRDGGVVEYQIGFGPWNDAELLFTHNGYNGKIGADTNPLDTREAFVADSRGYISSRVDLSSLAGQSVRFRFRIGTDFSRYDYGWFIDDVQIYTCILPYMTYLPLVVKQ
jgi:Zn-dependent metalloprotease